MISGKYSVRISDEKKMNSKMSKLESQIFILNWQGMLIHYYIFMNYDSFFLKEHVVEALIHRFALSGKFHFNKQCVIKKKIAQKM